jgi:hypothetical protein
VSRKKATEINIQDSTNSRNRSPTVKMPETIYRSEPQIDGPFYSLGMKCYRIQYYQRGQTYHVCRESSFHIERLADAQVIEEMITKMRLDSWDAWLRLVDAVRNTPATLWKGFVFIYGIDTTRTVIHG